MTKTIKLSAEELEKISQFESSISHWSTEHATLLLRAKKVLEAVDNLYLARQKTIDDSLAANDIKGSDVESVHISPNGELTVTMKATTTN